MKNKISISKAKSYQEIGEFWDAPDLSEVWGKTEEAKFEVDLQSDLVVKSEKYNTDKMTDKDIIIQKQKNRYQILLEIWRRVGGIEHERTDFLSVCAKFGIGIEEMEEYLDYLAAENLIDATQSSLEVALSHKGIIEIENSINYPQKNTEHFPSTIIQNFNAAVGAVQTGSHNTSNVNQNFGNSISDVLNLLSQLRSSLKELPEEQRQEATELTDFIEGEIVSESPNKTKLKAFLKQFGTFAANTASNVFATAIAKYYGIDS
jgi:hypothetical protein